MKKPVMYLAVAISLLSAAIAGAATDFGVNVNINIGDSPRVVAPQPPPAPAPVAVVVDAPPVFLSPSSLGFYVAVGVPYDLFYDSNGYYLCDNNVWYRGRSYNGPWMAVSYRNLPPAIRRHKLERIRYLREEEYGRYRGHEADYRGHRFHPGKAWKEDRKEERRREKEARKEERRWEKEERKEHKHGHRHDDD